MALLSSQIDTKAMVPVCRQLATTYEAGIPLLKAIEHVGGHSKNPKVRRVLRSMAEDLKQGSTLADASRRQSKYLSPFFIQLLASGEQAGHLDVMLSDLASYYEDRLTIKRSIVAAMIYPAILVCLAWFIGTFAIGMVREALASMTDSSRGGTSGIEDQIQRWIGFQSQAMIGAALVAVLFVILARMGVLRWLIGAVTTHIWPLSRVTRGFGMARFFRSFSLLIGSGLDVMKCIGGAASVTANPYIEKDLLQAIPRVRAGDTLVEAFSGSRYMTPLAREMLAVGETSGQLDHHLKKAAEYHLQEANHAVKVATTAFTTFIMLCVFALIGGIIIYFWVSLYGGLMDGLGI